MIGANLIKDMEQKSSGLLCPKMGHNVERKVSWLPDKSHIVSKLKQILI